MTYYTHINRNVIDANRKHGRNDPPVRFQKGKYGKATYAHEMEVVGSCRVIYSPHGRLLPCGARLVIQSETEPRVIK
jgi:hypothetical protein